MFVCFGMFDYCFGKINVGDVGYFGCVIKCGFFCVVFKFKYLYFVVYIGLCDIEFVLVCFLI